MTPFKSIPTSSSITIHDSRFDVVVEELTSQLNALLNFMMMHQHTHTLCSDLFMNHHKVKR